jgi:hypothetical protein
MQEKLYENKEKLHYTKKIMQSEQLRKKIPAFEVLLPS